MQQLVNGTNMVLSMDNNGYLNSIIFEVKAQYEETTQRVKLRPRPSFRPRGPPLGYAQRAYGIPTPASRD